MPLRYAILHHSGVPEPHYDLLFEHAPGGALRAYRAAAWPIAGETELIPLPDHRPLYLTYQGPISGDRGQVRRVEAGEYTIEPAWAEEGAARLLRLLPSGARLVLRIAGRVTLAPVIDAPRG